MSSKVRVRIAPSPTGSLHLGTARTALYNYLYAKRHQGTFILRLEDTDDERSEDRYTQDILDGLKWLGINWEEGPDIGGPYPPYTQTAKVDHYAQLAHQLVSKGLAYMSYETPEELSAMKEEQKIKGEPPRYDNSGRNLTKAQIEQYQAQGRVPSIRFKVEEPRVVTWVDKIKGEIAIDSSDLGGDMVIVKSNGIATYNFAVVIDDIDMKMTHVIRGEDHIHNTAKQILLYEALGADPPEFAHAALIFDLDRAKLSKRKHGEFVHIDRYRRDGYLPEALVNYLAQMSWTPPNEQEIFTLEEAGAMFDLDRVSKSPAVFDLDRLKWFNQQYITKLPLEKATELAKPYLADYDLSAYSEEEIRNIVESVRSGLHMLSEITPAVDFYFKKKLDISEESRSGALASESSKRVLQKALSLLDTFPWGDHKGCKSVVDALGKELSVKGKELYHPMRIALSGKEKGPDLGSIISILGPARVKQRIEDGLSLITVAIIALAFFICAPTLIG